MSYYLLRTARDFAAANMASVAHSDTTGNTTCDRWTLRHLVNHVIATTEVLGRVSRGEPISPEDIAPDTTAERGYSGADPVAAFHRVSDPLVRMYQQISSSERLTCTLLQLPRPPAPLFVSLCLLEWSVHGWDIGRSTGRTARIPVPLAETVLPFATRIGAGMPHQLPSFAEPTDAPPDASADERLLAFLGRSPRQGDETTTELADDTAVLMSHEEDR
ncbi:TIGR03086 family metal-binding protein [Actinopolyspora erythraea]|nr:TIGR03086 family metal-binding protein [Actinopolyspora erythraea]